MEKRSEEWIRLVFTCDDKYAMPLSVALTSLKKNKTESLYDIYVIYSEVNEEIKDKICELQDDDFVITFIKNESAIRLEQLGRKAVLHKEIAANSVSMTKFFISEILSDLDKVLYLDSDILILKDLKELYGQDLGDCYASVIPELDIGEYDYMCRLGVKHRHYFNSGVMLLNLKKMREDDISAKLVEYRINGLNYYMDQDAFNVVFNDNVIYLGYEYNCLCKHLDQFKRERDVSDNRFAGIYILHFAFKHKPWVYMMPGITEIFMDYYNISPFKNLYLYLAPYEMDNNYLFPFANVKANSNIVIYGAGRLGKMYKSQIEKTGYCNVTKWVDRNYEVLADSNREIESPEEINNCEYDYVVIAIAFEKPANEIKKYLVSMGIKQEKIVWKPIKLS